MLSAAASVATIATATILGLHKFPVDNIATETVQYQNSVKTKNQTQSILLPDGTRVSLRANTHIDITYTDKSRKISLLLGELHVDVSHDPTRPLSVYASKKAITAVGTAFGVARHSANSVDVLVTEGTIVLSDERVQSQEIQSNSNQATHVSAGQLIEIRSQKAKILHVANNDMEERLKWKIQSWRFNGESLEDITKLLSDQTGYTFKLENNQNKGEQVAGYIKYDTLDNLLKTLEISFGLKHKQKGNTITLSNK